MAGNSLLCKEFVPCKLVQNQRIAAPDPPWPWSVQLGQSAIKVGVVGARTNGRAQASANSFWDLRGRSSGWRTAQAGAQGPTATATLPDPGNVAGMSRRGCDAGGDPEEALAHGYFCRL